MPRTLDQILAERWYVSWPDPEAKAPDLLGLLPGEPEDQPYTVASCASIENATAIAALPEQLRAALADAAELRGALRALWQNNRIRTETRIFGPQIDTVALLRLMTGPTAARKPPAE